MEYTYRGITVKLVRAEGCIEPGVISWMDEDEEWGAYGHTLEDAQAAFREAVDDNMA